MASPPPLVVHKRRRATTRALLGDKYQETVTDIPSPPKPVECSEEYTKEKLQEGLLYADSVLRNKDRKLSPIGIRAMMIYKDACAGLLDMQDDTDDGVNDNNRSDQERKRHIRNSFLATIRGFEGYLTYTMCLRLTDSKDAEELMQELLKLQRTTFYARYGDIFGEICKTLRQKAEVHKVLGWQSLSKRYWTEISDNLKTEKPWYKRVLRGENVHEHCPLHQAIAETCHRLGFDTSDMLAAIYHYGLRNELLHGDLLPLIREGSYASLATMLSKDICQVPAIVESGDVLCENLFTGVIEAMIKIWFIRDKSLNWDNPESWLPTKELHNRTRELRAAKPESDARINEEVKAQIHKALMQKLARGENDKKAAALFADKLIISNPKTHVKRVASSELEEEVARAKRQKKDWDRLQNLMWQVRKMSETYNADWGTDLPPLIPHADPLLDEPFEDTITRAESPPPKILTTLASSAEDEDDSWETVEED